MKPVFGEIYLVRFHPAIGSELKRYRPAVIMSTNVNTIDPRFTLIAPLSTSTNQYNKDFEVAINNSSLQRPSILLAWYLKTIDIVRLEKQIGILETSDIKLAKLCLSKILDNGYQANTSKFKGKI